MDLEGNLVLERRPARRWVSILAVVIPVVACVVGVSWFVRAFISPPTISIPGSITLATTPTQPPPSRAERPPSNTDPVWPGVVLPSNAAPSNAAMYAPPTATVPPGAFPPPAPPPQASPMPSTRSAFVDTRGSTSQAMEAAAIPTAVRIPMPRPRPSETAIAAAIAAVETVPLPRARPAEEAPAPAPSSTNLQAEPQYDRHPIE